jgi:hypothetical protein
MLCIDVARAVSPLSPPGRLSSIQHGVLCWISRDSGLLLRSALDPRGVLEVR